MSGIEALKIFKERRPETLVVVITAFTVAHSITLSLALPVITAASLAPVIVMVTTWLVPSIAPLVFLLASEISPWMPKPLNVPE